ncbi:hypothetical protein QTP70_004844 [Hemibagrus guttatus]|uniref:Reverse transcriptase domain-containing protein n=1 Tax=Hemibagrus guttatus TaxID=175788 RepID=A0AAE0R990_9TELE|nr:hypothetical protein QTP70_004844 [Hemibagrus guttatus]
MKSLKVCCGICNQDVSSRSFKSYENNAAEEVTGEGMTQEDNDDEMEVEYINVEAIMAEDDGLQYQLPKHHRSAFNTIIPDLLQTKLMQISVPIPICQWITNFLTDRQQQVRLLKLTSGSLMISTGAPQGCILSLLLFSLYTNDCTATDQSVKLLKFTDNTTVIGLISDNEESAYRRVVEQLAVWCSFNNIELNTLKTVEMVVDY